MLHSTNRQPRRKSRTPRAGEMNHDLPECGSEAAVIVIGSKPEKFDPKTMQEWLESDEAAQWMGM